jgi:hypothetical protein
MKARILLPCNRWLGNLARYCSVAGYTSSENDLWAYYSPGGSVWMVIAPTFGYA